MKGPSWTETETIDKLYLELSQFTRAKSDNEIRLEVKLITAHAALDSILCLIGESEPDFVSPYQLRNAIIKECRRGLGKGE